MSDTHTKPDARPAGFLRRLGAATYDTLLLAAVLIMGTFAVLPLTGGEEIPPHWMPLFRIYLLMLSGGFFVLFWTWGNQTLGMKAWHLYVRRADGGALGLGDAVKRLAAGALTLGPAGLAYIPFDSRHRSLGDLLSGTVIVHVAPPKKTRIRNTD